MMQVHDFRDLDVYQKAFELQQQIFELSKSFPQEERYSLTDIKVETQRIPPCRSPKGH